MNRCAHSYDVSAADLKILDARGRESDAIGRACRAAYDALSAGPNRADTVMQWNESIQRGLKHTFFQDGLAADTHEMKPWEAYVEGWRDAWLTSADDLADAEKARNATGGIS